jgi:pseudoazurin
MRFVTYFFIVFVSSTSAYSKEFNIEMLNRLNGENMLYSQKIVNVNKGDIVVWKATTSGHNVEFINGGVPKEVGKFKSTINQSTQYTFDIPGIYAYWCTPHKSLGMIGFVIVDNDKSNLEDIKKIKYYGMSNKVAKTLISQIPK